MQVGDKIRIVNYGNPNDIELIGWASEQPNNIFIINWVDTESQTFGIEGCEYGIPLDSVDYQVVKGYDQNKCSI